MDGERFYTLYPSISNHNQLADRMGYFEDLGQYCGFCFYSDDVDALIAVDRLFDWSVYINHLEKIIMKNVNTLREKN